MLDTINQEFTDKLYQEKVLEEYRNPIKENRKMEIILIVTPSKNYFRCEPYNKNPSKVFEELNNAREYLKKFQKPTKD